MVKLIIYAFLAFLLFLTLIIYGIVILTYRKEKLDNNMILDPYTTDYYRNELDSIIQHRCIYNVDYRVGKLFSNTHSVTTDIPNDEIISMCNETIEEILNIIPAKMYLYLERIMGDKWLRDYVKTQTISYILNYTKLTIEDLTIDKFGEKR